MAPALAALVGAAPAQGLAQSASGGADPNEPGCEVLQFVAQESDPRGKIYTVRNTSNVTMSFHINQAGVASSAFSLRPRATQQFGVEASVGLGLLGRFINRNNPDVDKAEFFRCYRDRAAW